MDTNTDHPLVLCMQGNSDALKHFARIYTYNAVHKGTRIMLQIAQQPLIKFLGGCLVTNHLIKKFHNLLIFQAKKTTFHLAQVT